MTLIQGLLQCAGSYREGVFRLAYFQARMDRFGRPYGRVTLEDRSGALTAYVWHKAMPRIETMSVGTSVQVALSTRLFNGRLQGDIHSLVPLDPGSVNSIQLLPRRWLSSNEGAARLQTLIEQCHLPALREFLTDVFADQNLAYTFLTAPASQSHHHAYLGGLADHSLEVALSVGDALKNEAPEMRALGVVAGLLHDIGKIRTLRADGSRTPTGFVLSHNALTLELLAPALTGLDRQWPDGANAVRYLLTWRPSLREPNPLLPTALVLQCADRYSSAANVRDGAFQHKPDWQRFARLDGPGPISRFWRPRSPRS